MIKQGFQFLYSFRSCLGQEVMGLFGHTDKVSGAIVISDSVQMMNNPTFWQRFTVSFFPDKNMLTNVAMRCSNKNITIYILNLATLPLRMFFRWTGFHQFNKASPAHLVSILVHWLPTLGASFRILLRMTRAIPFASFSPFLRAIVFRQNLAPMLLGTNGAQVPLVTCRAKNLPAVPTFNANHLPYKLNTATNKSQLLCGRMTGGQYG